VELVVEGDQLKEGRGQQLLVLETLAQFPILNIFLADPPLTPGYLKKNARNVLYSNICNVLFSVSISLKGFDSSASVKSRREPGFGFIKLTRNRRDDGRKLNSHI
jgi:hypothetical protein